MVVINGNDGSNVLIGSQKSDVIKGFASRDKISGRNGNDRIYGGEGDDLINGGNGNDLIYGDRFSFRNLPFIGGSSTPLRQSFNDKISGGKGHDRIFGELGNDTLSGGFGNDLVRGGDGSDRILGGLGNDRLYGDGGNDRIEGGDGNDVLFGNLGNDDIYGNAGNDKLFGGSGNDRLYGGSGNDLLLGQDGNDVLIGVDSKATDPGRGEIDRLIGGADVDKFILGRIGKAFYDDGVVEVGNNGESDYGLIQDFVVGEDIIQLAGNETYVLQDTVVNGVSGTGIYIDEGLWVNGQGQFFQARELVGLVAGVDASALTVNDGGPLTTIV